LGQHPSRFPKKHIFPWVDFKKWILERECPTHGHGDPELSLSKKMRCFPEDSERSLSVVLEEVVTPSHPSITFFDVAFRKLNSNNVSKPITIIRRMT
jgi:hypothetical protein